MSREITSIWLLCVVYTAFNVVYSIHYGRLSVPPTYDDIGYISNGYTLLNSGYKNGWGRWLTDTIVQTWHAPITALQACMSFALFNKHVWGPYLLNGFYLVALLLMLRKALIAVSALAYFCIVISILSWPLLGYLIVEFRPDIPTNLFMALGGWHFAKNHREICKEWHDNWNFALQASWPFLLALWLKPSFSPVVAGVWISTWGILFVADSVVLKNKGLPWCLVSNLTRSSLILGLGFLPYLLVSGWHLKEYFVSNVFGENQESWTLPLSMAENLNYYLIGEGGWTTMGWWILITPITITIATLVALHKRDNEAVIVGAIYGTFAFVSWVGMTLLRNKSPWFGSLVSSYLLGMFIAASGYLIKQLHDIQIATRVLPATFVILGLFLHKWPNSDGALPGIDFKGIPAYSREAVRVYAETCNMLDNLSEGRRTTVIVPTISALVNPDLAELCGLERAVNIIAPRLYTNGLQHLAGMIHHIDALSEDRVLALILSEDFPGIAGTLPSSKRNGSINHLFDSSITLSQVSFIKGPNDEGVVRIFKNTNPFSPIINERGVGAIEGPYPAQNLPLVRWLKFPRAEFDINVTPGQRTKLLLIGHANSPIIGTSLRVSSGEVGHCIFTSNSFQECSLEFLPKNKTTHISIDFQDEGTEQPTSESGQLAVLISRLEIKGEEPLSEPQPATSAFTYIDFLEGFGSVEGPYPQWKLPVVVCGRGDASRIGVAGAAKQAGTLSLDWRPGVAILGLDIQAQGKTVGHCPSAAQGTNFLNCSVDLPLGTLADGLVFRYQTDQPITDKMHNSALFKKIRFIARNGPTND